MSSTSEQEAEGGGGGGGGGETSFSKIATEILDAAEKITNRLEEGLAVIFDASSSSSAGSAQQQNDNSNPYKSSSSGGRETLTQEQLQDELLHGGEFSDEELQMMDGDMPDSPLQGMAESVLGDIMANQARPQSPLEHFHAFRHAISWSEPFILYLLAFQVFMFCSSIYVSRKERGLTLRLIVMISIAALVRGAESLNHWASRHWAQFATQNYFDKKGIFVSVMVCAPLLLDSLIMLLFFLREASQLLVQVKTAQLKKQRKQSQSNKKADDKKATGTSTGAASKRSKKTKKED